MKKGVKFVFLVFFAIVFSFFEVLVFANSEKPEDVSLYCNFSEEDMSVLSHWLEDLGITVSPENVAIFFVQSGSLDDFFGTAEDIASSSNKISSRGCFYLFLATYKQHGEVLTDGWFSFQIANRGTETACVKEFYSVNFSLMNSCKDYLESFVDKPPGITNVYLYYVPSDECNVCYLLGQSYERVLLFLPECVEYKSVSEFHNDISEYRSVLKKWRETVPEAKKNLETTGGYYPRVRSYVLNPEDLNRRLAERISEVEQDQRREDFLSAMIVILPSVGVGAIVAAATVLLLRRRKKAKAVSELPAPLASDAEDPPIDSQ